MCNKGYSLRKNRLHLCSKRTRNPNCHNEQFICKKMDSSLRRVYYTCITNTLATSCASTTCVTSFATRGRAACAMVLYTDTTNILATPYAPITYSTLHAARGTTVSTTFMIAYFKGTLNAQASIGIRRYFQAFQKYVVEKDDCGDLLLLKKPKEFLAEFEARYENFELQIKQGQTSTIRQAEVQAPPGTSTRKSEIFEHYFQSELRFFRRLPHSRNLWQTKEVLEVESNPSDE